MSETDTPQRHECKTVFVNHLDDGFEPKYAIVRNATVWLGTGPNGNYLGKVNTVTVNGVPIEPEDKVRLGNYHESEMVVKIEDGEARISTDTNT